MVKVITACVLLIYISICMFVHCYKVQINTILHANRVVSVELVLEKIENENRSLILNLKEHYQKSKFNIMFPNYKVFQGEDGIILVRFDKSHPPNALYFSGLIYNYVYRPIYEYNTSIRVNENTHNNMDYYRENTDIRVMDNYSRYMYDGYTGYNGSIINYVMNIAIIIDPTTLKVCTHHIEMYI